MLYSAKDYQRVRKEKEELDLGRSQFRRDFARLLHSPAFRRLQGKTQLFPGHESDFFRNRLTHSLEVAQIAKGLAQQINKRTPAFKRRSIDLDLVEFAGLAHDLGHPPFGHNGEHALDDCMKKYGGFEGNAQTLRILSRVEKKIQAAIGPSDDICGITPEGIDRRLGLNLTYRSLAAVLKYDNPIPLRRKKDTPLEKGYYESERELVEKIKAHVGVPTASTKFKTVECQIMDIADDIAYSTYDLEDAMKGGFSHPMQLLAKVGDESLLTKLHEKVAKEVPKVTPDEVFAALTDLFMLNGADTPALEQYTTSKMLASDAKMRSEFTSELIGRFMRGVSVTHGTGADIKFSKVEVAREIRIKIESLKHLNFLLMIMSPRLKVVEYRGYEVVKTIFETLDSEEGHLLLPDDLQVMFGRLTDTDSKKRLICDFVAGMTDRYAVEFYSRLRESGASIFKPI
ncbi:deoxyguanosinetriphosphate triphosphohydrolase family protein [Curvibacter sp. PAE-UM]|uniref:deoxyguanosinetriphosphate triphosphohydrolase family protein n=1 Tax=Curvibacter sp. PAE-UM TaxID=1714344 RepID=UPI0009E8B4E2|nr:dNTP triphosphohydrolase [Curvibacter sp. PAE-UM]